ncbi:hypothetical protein BN2537_7703 [Streptomyces venezuelae]|nr:hypothetical protein BN2537_7703 [Streptomyces venezuelae]
MESDPPPFPGRGGVRPSAFSGAGSGVSASAPALRQAPKSPLDHSLLCAKIAAPCR